MPVFKTKPEGNAQYKLKVIALLYFTLLAASFLTDLYEVDFFWHLATGRWIYEHNNLPQTDPFSITSGEPDVRDSLILKGYWLNQILYYLVWLVTGPAGIIVLRSAAITLASFIIYKHLKKHWHTPLALLFVLPFIYEMRFYINLEVRPNQTTILLFIALIYMLEDMLSKRNVRLKDALPIYMLMLFWANSHPGFIYGSLIMLSFMAGETLTRIARKDETHDYAKKIAILSAGIALGFANPGGIGVIPALIKQSGTMYHNFSFESRSTIEVFGKGFYSWGYAAVVALTASTIVLNIGRMRIRHIIAILSVLAISLMKVRFLIFFTASGLMLCAQYWRWPSLSEIKGKVAALVAFMLLMLHAYTFLDKNVLYTGTVFRASAYPFGAVDFVRRTGIEGRMFNTYDWGGFLMYYLPGQKVFIDPRGMRASNNSMVVDYLSIINASTFKAGGKPEWRYILDRYDIDFIIVQKRLEDLSPVALGPALLNDNGYTILYEDDLSYVFKRSN